MKRAKRLAAMIMMVMMIVTMLPTASFAATKKGAASKECAVVVEYTYSDGTTAEESYKELYKKGAWTESVNVTVPQKEGYTASLKRTGAAAKGNVYAKLNDEQTELTYKIKEISDDITFKIVYTEQVVEEPAPETPAEEPVVETPADTGSTTDFEEVDLGDVTVKVSAPEGAFPAGTTMDVAKVNAADYADKVDGQIKMAVDISFKDKDGNEIEPKKDIDVQMTLAGLQKKGDYKVVHIPDEAKSAEPVDAVVDTQVDPATVSFSSNEFSVYVVIDEGDNGEVPYATVNFHGKDDSVVATYYVKNEDEMPPADEADRDPNKSYLDHIVTDPGIGSGNLAEGLVFLGWHIGNKADITATTEALDINKVRQSLADLEITADMDPVEVWPVILKVFTVTYLDEQEISMGTDEIKVLPSDTGASYTVSKTYSPADPTKNFEGWLPDDDSLIENAKYQGQSVTKPYKMSTTMTIKGSIVFRVDAPKGNWLVFDENAKGATYNAPQFVKSGSVTQEPGLEMKRLGYRFVGWYTNPEGTGDPFEFGHEISGRTIIYAKWEKLTTAPYVILIWKQNVSGDGYDFAASKTQTDATVDAAITVTHNNSRVTVTGGGKTYTYDDEKGFKYKSADSNKTVDSRGNTVVNVYYDRETVTFNFHVYGDVYTKVAATSIGYYSGTYYIPDESQSSGYRAVSLRRRNGIVYIDNGTFFSNWQRFTGDLNEIYTRSETWSTVETMTGLYGSTLAENGYTWPTSYDWYLSYSGEQGSGNRRTFMDAFIPAGVTGMTHEFYARTSSGTATIHFYKQNDNLNGYTEANTVRVAADSSFALSDKYNGFKLVSYSTNGTNWNTNVGTPDSQGYYNSVNFNNQLHIRFDRKVYSILFEDGVYVDGNGNKLTDQSNLGQLKVKENIAYGASTRSYNKGQSDYYDPSTDHTVAGFVFEGWYIDDACTTPYTFTTMPEGITVYAKWRQVQYRVFLHPNAKIDGVNDSSLDWGDTEEQPQEMNFRVSYMGQLSVPTGVRTDYEFIGWFTDESATSPFDADTKFTDSVASVDYDKNDPANYTDPMNKWGEIEGAGGSNSDLTGWDDDNNPSTPGKDRFWITKKLDLYGKWSEMLNGAQGIGLIYDVNGGSNAPTDTKKYKDNIDAIAGTAATPPTDQIFLYWVVQKWDGNEYVDLTDEEGKLVTVYPGAPFTVKKAYAKEADLAPGDEGYEVDPETGEPIVFKSYTMQLRAEYGPSEAPKDTYINWYRNEGAANPIYTSKGKDNKGLQINEATDIYDLTTADGFTVKRGHEFLGWARMPEYELDPQTHQPVGAPITEYPDLTEDDLLLKYDAETGKYQYNKGTDASPDWVNVSKVAADERMPYHALYAVWRDVFYIIHSNDKSVDVVKIKRSGMPSRETYTTGYDDDTGKYTTFYYGGYGVLAGKMEDSDPAGFTLTKGGSEATYSGSYEWSRANAQKSGTAFDNGVGDVYYLKEVSTDYLAAPKIATVTADYGAGDLTSVSVLSVIDTTIYRSGGINGKKGTFAGTFTMSQNGGETTTKSPEDEDMFGLEGFFTVNAWTTEEGTYDLKPFWITFDNVTVNSNATRTITISGNQVR